MATLLGNNLLVRLGADETGDVILCATNCTLNINQATTESSCKGDPDSGGNKWSTSIASTATWNISTDGLYDPAIASKSYDALAKYIIDDANGTADNSVSVVFQIINSGAIAGDVEYYSGTAIITSCVLNGPVDEFATYTVEMKGTGALAQNVKV